MIEAKLDFCAAALVFPEDGWRSQGKFDTHPTVVLILFVGDCTSLFSARSGRKRSSSVPTMLRTASAFTSQDVLPVMEPTAGARRQTLTEFQRPDTFPDFTRCDQTTPEPNSVWKDVILHGGPARGFSHNHAGFTANCLRRTNIDDLITLLAEFLPQQSIGPVANSICRSRRSRKRHFRKTRKC